MSDVDDSKHLKCLPPKSLMNIEDSEKVWEVINKKYPKVAPLLSVMESVLEQAEILLEQIQLSDKLGIEEANSELINEKLKRNTNVLESYAIDFDDSTFNKSEIPAEENSVEISTSEDQRIDLTSVSTQDPESNYNLMERFTPSEESHNLEKTESVKFLETREKPENSRMIAEKHASKIKKFPEDNGIESEDSLLYFKKVVGTIKRNEETMLMTKQDTLKKNVESNEKLPEVTKRLRKKSSETASIDEWNKVINNDSQLSEVFSLEDY